jgi:hypothetical protein
MIVVGPPVTHGCPRALKTSGKPSRRMMRVCVSRENCSMWCDDDDDDPPEDTDEIIHILSGGKQ